MTNYELRRSRGDRNSELLTAARLTDLGRTFLLGYLLAAIPTTELERALSSVVAEPANRGYVYPEATS